MQFGYHRICQHASLHGVSARKEDRQILDERDGKEKSSHDQDSVA